MADDTTYTVVEDVDTSTGTAGASSFFEGNGVNATTPTGGSDDTTYQVVGDLTSMGQGGAAPSSFYENGNVYEALTLAPDILDQITQQANAAAKSASDAASIVATGADKTYVDTAVAPKADKTYVDSQDALKADKTYVDSQDALKAPLASPAFSGAPTAPSPPNADNSTKLATTAWVQTNAPGTPPATATPLVDGTAAVGTATKYAREDHVHPTDTSRAPVASPTFTGVPAAPTASPGTNTTQLATTAYVTTALTPFRVKLTAARTYYVSNSGSNSNDGLTSGTPFLTIQKAYDTISQTLDTGGYNITIQCAVGTYDGISVVTPWTGGGNITIDVGNGTISATTQAIYVSSTLPGVLTIQNLSLTATGMNLITMTGPGTMNIGNITMYGAATAGYDMVSVSANSYLHFVGNITFGACSGWREVFYARIGGIIDLYGSFGQTMTMTGNMSWSDSFAYVEAGGAIQAISGARTINVGSYTMTGKRYGTNPMGFINTQGGGANYFPGSIAGSGSGTYL